jgi:hypothetical protein
MKELVIEFRQYLAEKLLSWAWDIAPKSKKGAALKNTVWAYFYGLKIKQK